MNNDYELIYLAQENNEDARNILYQKYDFLINTKVKKIYQKYQYINTDNEDLKLELRFIFDNAINNYNQDKEAKFSSYLNLCFNTKIKDIIKNNFTYKNKINNNMISLDEDVNGIPLYELISDYKSKIDIDIDINSFIYMMNNNLSKYEKEIFKYLLDGKNPHEIAKSLNVDLKKIKNTIYRLKTKIKIELYGGNYG